MFYAGIGSRYTPSDILGIMTDFAGEMERRGFILRSGGAAGADQAFQKGVLKKAQIWLPWRRFEWEFQRLHPEHDYKGICVTDDEAYNSVRIFHPQSSNLSDGAVAMMRRNFRQVVGMNGEANSSFIVCWTPNGEVRGGTGQALRIAAAYGIPVWNLGKQSSLEAIQVFFGL